MLTNENIISLFLLQDKANLGNYLGIRFYIFILIIVSLTSIKLKGNQDNAFMCL